MREPYEPDPDTARDAAVCDGMGPFASSADAERYARRVDPEERRLQRFWIGDAPRVDQRDPDDFDDDRHGHDYGLR